MPTVILPHSGWTERSYQEALWDYLRDGGKRAIAVWHRRAGKDDVALHAAAIAMHRRVGNVWHCLPEYAQGRKALWTAVNAHTGKRRIDEAFPELLRETTIDNEMFIRFKNGSTWQVVGSDNYDKTVGASPMGITYSEYALANPSAWAYHRPMLQENDGWALFITTPRGRNHALAMLNYAQQTKDWFWEVLTARDTGALSEAELNEALNEYRALYGHDMGTAQFEQEYLCSFNAAILGAIWAHELAELRKEGRVLPIEPPPGVPVSRAWDLGVGHSTAIWFFAVVGPQVHVYDCYVASGVGLEHYRDHIDKLYRERGWTHGVDWVPHDARVKELGTGRTRVETMKLLGLNPQLAPAASWDDGINAVRHTLPLAVFHPRCDEGDLPGIGGLEQYRREWDDEKKTFKRSAVEDWTTDIADSFRYLALSWRKAPLREIKVPRVQGWTILPPEAPRRGGIQL